ncbi:hypothetical protein TW95_gp1048 [Pandoravirus inopinatum]|uniref:Uncharacterized protein n=1 Tax=Pandoravirus inopinatum TaxID=1605721 RepID=A0A0B5JDI8_9VIRU|nr:hypothetical protein TW95_gp1048 [Pandoravirus inopinatum]AJF97782.1 hypothetical protein [Pandoravirus inopinatum]
MDFSFFCHVHFLFLSKKPRKEASDCFSFFLSGRHAGHACAVAQQAVRAVASFFAFFVEASVFRQESACADGSIACALGGARDGAFSSLRACDRQKKRPSLPAAKVGPRLCGQTRTATQKKKEKHEKQIRKKS